EEAASISHPVEREQTDVLTKRDERGYGRSRRRRAKTPLQVAKARVRMRYAKGNEVRYLSHLDVVRVFERALRRAEVPISYSQGFHPHPKIAFGPPLALGMTSRAEYVDMQFEQPYSQDTIAALDRALPRGFAILDAKPTFGKTPSLSSIITQAEYRVFFDRKFSLEQIEEAVAKLLERSAVWVRREIKKVVKEVDIRPHILDARVEDDPEGVSLRLRLGTTETGHVKSSEVVSQMLSLPQDEVAVFLTERTEQFVERGGHLMTPMESV
ncbi:MAG: TIGR03936 family radical SAM-associated protein, partial [bacterium]